MERFSFEYEEFKNRSALSIGDQKLIAKAFEAAEDLAYAPYSKFRVGAAILLTNGTIVQGSNQENAASPAGICAERSALSTAANMYPKEKIVLVAIAYIKNDIEPEMAQEVLSPCGICRQTMSEYVTRQKASFPIILCSASDRTIKIKDVMHLLPFSFGSEML
jgi:cytidine deaminase